MGGDDGAFSKREATEWLALLAVHEQGRLHSNALPHLPRVQSVPHDKLSKQWLGEGEQAEHTFDGTPRLLRPMLKEMMRFNRPLITWDIFEEAAPAAWPNPAGLDGSDALAQRLQDHRAGSKKPRRDAAAVNGPQHMLYTQAEREREDKDLLNKRWADEHPGHVSALKEGGFYVVRLEKGQGERWLCMGVVQVKQTAEGAHFFWLGRSSQGKDKGVWPSTVTFKPWPSKGKQAHDKADVKMAICEITQDWLPDGHSLEEAESVVINSEYRKRLELFGHLHGLVTEQPVAASSSADTSGSRPTTSRPHTGTTSKAKAVAPTRPAPAPRPTPAPHAETSAALPQQRAMASKRRAPAPAPAAAPLPKTGAKRSKHA